MNNTSSTSAHEYRMQGWQSSCNRRGTFDILSSCLILIFASTWTVLHLNIPAPKDSWWTKGTRKAKWMAVNVLFPEFIFAHAMEERSMAADALQLLRLANGEIYSDLTWWQKICDTLGFFKGVQDSLRVIIQRRNSTDPVFKPRAQSRDWTMTHALFANMGGFHISKAIIDPSYMFGSHPTGDQETFVLDAFQVISLYVRNVIETVPKISRREIEDRGKADPLVKALVLMQFSWLALSVIARKIDGLPIAQLEIATLGFTCCAALTYSAAWQKPKDVDTAIEIRIPEGKYVLPNFYAEYTTSFFATFFTFDHPIQDQNWHLNRYMSLYAWTARIANDNFAGDRPRDRPMTGWLIVGNLVFGGLHCLAWDFDFPTEFEKLLWRISTPTAMLAPLLLLLVVHSFSLPNWARFAYYDQRKIRFVLHFCAVYILKPLICLIYVGSRLCVIILALASLRRMPEDVYKTTWTRYIPSIN
ncbi:MAG: hypothetical protein ASARMPREDX12_002130 [Alectoria sarmentosa]|nr:MAG: hypothetical protein ASARMPREDX12_002130 [Alectoria sarmentosa]